MSLETDGTRISVPPSRRIWLLVIVLITVVADQVTKQLVLDRLTPGEYVPLVGEHVGLQLLFNSGGAFGLPAPSGLFLFVAALVTVLVWRVLRQGPTITAFIGFALLLGGAYGNIIDRLTRGVDGFGSGAVVDFVAWGSFPRFNVADAAITVGVALIFLSLLSNTPPSHDERSPTAADPDVDGAA
ncbi:MAG: signal peptidase II [Nitriliruptoraceae bacterium]